MRASLLMALGLAVTTWSSPAPAESGADLQYLQHSGWVVRTATHVLVFDYVESLPSGAILPATLMLQADAFHQRRVVVFVSHSHDDHFDAGITRWAEARPDIQYVVGSTAVDVPGARMMGPRETWSSDGVTVTTTSSTDEGVGFMVTVDSLTFYHAGDHARWTESLDQEFTAEIEWLKGRGVQIDIAFFPVATGAACDPRPSIWEGVRSAANTLAPRVLIPMHVGCPDRLDLYMRFRAEVGSQLPSTQVSAPERLGQEFHYSAGRVTPRD